MKTKKRQKPEADAEATRPDQQPKPIRIKQPLPPDVVKKMREYMKDSYIIERQWWQITR